MKKSLLFIFALCMTLTSCDKEAVKVNDGAPELENASLRTSNGETRRYFSRLDTNNPVVEGCEYPGTDCFDYLGYVAVSNLGDFILGAPWDDGDPIVIQEHVGNYQTELAPYLHENLISGVLNGSLTAEKSGSSEDIGDTVYLKFSDTDGNLVSVAPFVLEG